MGTNAPVDWPAYPDGIEPDEPLQTLLAVEDSPAVSAPLAQMMPSGFDLEALLTFLPDVRLKRDLTDAAATALAIDVAADGGLEAADAARPDLQDRIKFIESCFETPTSLANQLHKRLTGLRSDFCQDGTIALETIGKRIVTEQRRRDAIAAESRRAVQEQADREARAASAKAAEEAAKNKAPAAIVEALKEQARTATAPPVASPTPAPVLKHTSTVPAWKGRFIGTAADAEPNPVTAALSAQQQEMFMLLLDGIRNGTVPLAAVQVDWSYVNKRAVAEKSTLAIPGIEAFDAGGVRSKRR